MVLHANNFFTALLRKFSGEIIRMQIRSNPRGTHAVELWQIGAGPPESRIGLLGFQIAEVLADENIFADGQRHCIF